MATTGRPYRIGISGSYGGLNLGDEAILESIVRQLRRSVPAEITVFSRDAEDTRKRHDVDRAVPVRSLYRNEVIPEVERLDLLILGGGGILYDAEARTYLREVMIAHERGIPVMTYALGAGPLDDPRVQEAVRQGLGPAAAVTVREVGARKLLEDIGVHRDVLVTADPALLLDPQPLPPDTLIREGLDGCRHLIGMSVREPGAAAPHLDELAYHALLANAADFMVDRFDAEVVFMPMEPLAEDIRHSHAVISQMLRAPRATVLKGEYTSGQLLTLMGHFNFAVGMRLHFLIFAALQWVPFVALPYAGKVAGFLEQLEIVMPPIKLVNPGRLIAYIDHYWDHRAELKAKIRDRLPELQRRAHETGEIAVRLLAQSRRKPH